MMFNTYKYKFLSVLFFSFLFIFSLLISKNAEAATLCSGVAAPLIKVDVAGQSFTEDGTIYVDPGTVLNFTVFTYAEADSDNYVYYPNSQYKFYTGPSRTGRTLITDPIFSNTGIDVNIGTYCDTENGLPPGADNLSIAIVVNSVTPPPANATVNVSSNVPTNWVVSGPTPNQGQGSTSGTWQASPGTYSITADNINCYSKSISPSSSQTVASGGTIGFSINYSYDSGCGNPPPPPPPSGSGTMPSVDITANGSNGPVYIESGSSVNISWSSTNATSCSVTPSGWGGTSGSQSSGALNSSVNYIATCTGSGGSSSDSVQVSVSPAAGSCGTMVTDTAVRGCVGLIENPAVYKPDAASCSQYCKQYGGTACEWLGNGNCYVEYAQSGCYLETGHPGWYSAVCNQPTPTATLTTSISSGSGTISGTGINCPGYCAETYQLNTWVTLNATAAAGYTHTGWGGACNSQTSTCTIQMDSNKSVSASFSTSQFSLQVSKSGSGTGTLTSSPAGINCGATCISNYNNGTSVTLTPTPTSGNTFGGWAGDCSGTGGCTLSMTANRSVGAIFNASFNYALGNSGNSNAQKDSTNVSTQNVISKTLTAGVTQAVSLTASGIPAGVSYSFSNAGCAPGCSSTITFTISPTAVAGSYPITITGSPLGKTTTFNLVITAAPMSVSCVASPQVELLGNPVTWNSTVTGGSAPFTYRWVGSDISLSQPPTTASFTKNYSTIGLKTASVTVTDHDGGTTTCPPGTVRINFNPNFQEF